MTRVRLLLSRSRPRYVCAPVTGGTGARRREKNRRRQDRAASKCNKAERAAQPQPHSTFTVAAFRDAFFFCRALSLSRPGIKSDTGTRRRQARGRPAGRSRNAVRRSREPLPLVSAARVDAIAAVFRSHCIELL
jgi:hypothetical protein